MPITARSRVVFERNRFGEFAERCERAAHDTVEEIVTRGARTSRAMAPAGKERWRYSNRPGYVPLKRSIQTETSGSRGSWYSIAPHALHVEYGTAAHLIHGKLKFSWRGGKDGWFVWNRQEWGHTAGLPTHHYDSTTDGKIDPNYSYYTNADAGGAWVRHPGTGAQPFMRPAYERVVRGQMMQVAREKFPG